jgi:hypothetical protein
MCSLTYTRVGEAKNVCKSAQAESVTRDFGCLTYARVGEAKKVFFALPTLV